MKLFIQGVFHNVIYPFFVQHRQVTDLVALPHYP